MASDAVVSCKPATTGIEPIVAVNEPDFSAMLKLPSSLPVVAVEPKVISASAANLRATAHEALAAHVAVAAMVGALIARPVIGVELLPTTVMAILRAPLTLV